MSQQYHHLDAFKNPRWFIGVVEDIDDPAKANRVRVRCIGYHSNDRGAVPTDKLPWASFMHTGAHMSAPMLLPSDWVVGMFLDGDVALQPVIFGMLDGIPAARNPEEGFNDPSGVYPKTLNKPTNSPLARNDLSAANPITYSKGSVTSGVKTASGSSWSEPASPYAAKYPSNHVMHTDAGNVIELDDTPNAERVQIFHKSGSLVEFHTDGSVVYRSLNGRYQVTMGNDNIAVAGDCNITCKGNMNLLAGGKVTIGGSSVEISGATSVNVGAGLMIGMNAGAVVASSAPMVSMKGSAIYAADAPLVGIGSGMSVDAPSVKTPPVPSAPSVSKYKGS